MTLQAVLFDMDGLLVNSEPLWYEVEAGIMARMGSPWGQADQEHLIGGSLRRSTAYMRRKAAVPVPEETIAEWLTQGMASLVRRRGVPMMPGAAALLAGIGAAGVPHALVTSAEPEIMEAALDSIGVRFPVTVCAADVIKGKPDPEPYLEAAARLGWPRRAAWRSRTHPPGSRPRTPRGARSSRCPASRRRRAWPGSPCRPWRRSTWPRCGPSRRASSHGPCRPNRNSVTIQARQCVNSGADQAKR